MTVGLSFPALLTGRPLLQVPSTHFRMLTFLEESLGSRNESCLIDLRGIDRDELALSWVGGVR